MYKYEARLNGEVVATRKSKNEYIACAVTVGYLDAEAAAASMDQDAERFEDPNDFTGWDPNVKAERAAEYRSKAASIRSGAFTPGNIGWTSNAKGIERLKADAIKMNYKVVIVDAVKV